MSLYATPIGTARYKNKFAGKVDPDHFRLQQGLWLPSIGFGTYLGEEDERTDQAYAAAIEQAVLNGCNLIDTAINYRCQRSERVIGRVLQKLIGEKKISRDEVVVASKGGFLPFDDELPADTRAYLQKTFIEKGICKSEDIVAGCHVMTPRYLENQLHQSLSNLKLECLDIYYLHNPETQLQEISEQEFDKRIREVFAFLENQVKKGKICFYGAATWTAFRSKPDSKEHVSLEKLVAIAAEAGGKNHHFKFIQLPLNLGMPEAITSKNQTVDGATLSSLEAAQKLGLTVVTSASILQGRLSRGLPPHVAERFPGLRTDAQRALQFTRSAPGVATALVGMANPAHAAENLALAASPTLTDEKFTSLFLK